MCAFICKKHEGLVPQKNHFLLVLQVWPAEKKTRKSQFYGGSPSLCKYFTNIFFSIGSSHIFAAVYLRICSTGPLIFPHPSASLLECQLILLKKSTTTEMGFNLYPNIIRKWNWFQIFLSEMHLSQKNGSRGAFFLISSFLKGLTYSGLGRDMAC